MGKRDVRLRYAVRNQVQMRAESLDQMLPPDHAVRSLWDVVCGLDLSGFLANVGAMAGQPGAPAFDPRVVLSLWLQATLDGIGSARELSRLCAEHLVYRWLCGDEPINYHTLADFRMEHAAELDRLLTQTAATLCAAGVASLTRVAQDGMRVRASAGSGSFRRGSTIARHLAEAQAQVVALQSQVHEDDGAAARRSQAARQRAAGERVARLQHAQAELAQLQAANTARAAMPKNRHQGKDPQQLRVSTTDPEARSMKMGDGGFRPAYNVQFATTTTGGVIVGVHVTAAGSDYGQLEPMLEQLKQRYDTTPHEVLVDGGFATHDIIQRLHQQGIDVYAPQKRKAQPDQPCRRPDAPALAAWRARMTSAAGQAIYQQRASTAEWVNAMTRQRGLQQFNVRGLTRVKTVATWHALTHNIHRAMRQQP